MYEKQSELIVLHCTENDFANVAQIIKELQLDNNDLHFSQFIVAKDKDKIVGFGRLRKYEKCIELCSLGIIEPFRNRGIGTWITKELINKALSDLYVVTVIPDFFSRFGFKHTLEFPAEIESKITYCTGSLPVPSAYIVMKLK